jgi:outer membrane protein assembly factor BamB
MMTTIIARLSLIALLLTASPCWADDKEPPPAAPSNPWPQWRGPGRTNLSKETGLLQTWPEQGPPLAWKATGLGTGVASLSIAAGRIYTLGSFDNAEHLLALKQTDGSLLWKVRIGPAAPGMAIMQWLSQRTPTCDVAGDLVWGISGQGILVCCQASTGRELWRKDYVQDFQGKRNTWGYSDYPLVEGDRLICTPGGDSATLVALDKRSGTVIWRCPIPGERSAYSAVIPFDMAGKRYFVQQMSKGAVIVSADGKLVWQGVKEIGTGSATVQTTLVQDNLLFFANGWARRCALVKVTPSKDGLAVEPLYSVSQPLDAWLGSAVLLGDKVFTSCGRCLDLHTGKSLYPKLDGLSGRTSMTCADGRFIYRTGDNLLLLLEAGAEGWIKRGEFKVPKVGVGWCFPVVGDGKLYLRDQDVLHCYDLRDRQEKQRPPDAIFVPTPQDVVDKMLELAKVEKKDIVYDLGCGDGRIVVTAAKKYGCRAVGVDIDPECVRMARQNVATEKLASLVRIDLADLFLTDLSQADLVALYLLPKLNVKLLPQLAKLRPGARIVSHQFAIEGIPADQEMRYRSTEDGVEHTLYLWTAPLRRK